ncbi:MAG: ParB/RepB/Spo0J family partition protein [Ruminococcus sp.]|nr:ParB/RepB/Spo0J family partition protein [Ruminococcus sp.]
MAKKERLKNGLDMLFEDHEQESLAEENQATLRISLIEPDKNQPRVSFDEESLKELADNISLHGVLQPILVRPIDGGYKIVAGERRWRAARLAGLEEIPVVIKELDDLQAAQISLVENLQREDLDPIEEASAYRRLMDDYGMTQEQVAKSVGKSRSAIANSVRLLNLPDHIKKALSEKKITVGHARAMCGVSGDRLREMFTLAMEGSSVREIEHLNRIPTKEELEDEEKEKNILQPIYKYPPLDNKLGSLSKYAREAELAFRDYYGVHAKIYPEKNGRLSLKFYVNGEEELKELVNQFIEHLHN